MILGTKNSRNNSHCSLNLRMDGSDDGTSFPDSSSFGHTMTRTNAVTKTGTKKFGTASGYFDGASRLVHASAAEFNLGSKDYTLEYWVNCASHTGFVYAHGDGQPGNKDVRQFYHRTSNPYLQLYEERDSVTPPQSQTITSCTTTASTSSWNHVVFQRSGTYFQVFVNGIRVVNELKALIFNADNAEQVNVGVRLDNAAYQLYFTGYLDSVMLIKNVARYKRNFKVPNRAA